MKVSTSSRFFGQLTLCAAALSLIQRRSTVHSAMTPFHRGPYGDFLLLDSAPDTVAVNTSVKMSYTCSVSCRVGLEIVLSTPDAAGLVTFRRSWTHTKRLNATRTRRIPLQFPPAVVYGRDFFLRRTVEARDVVLRAWLVYLNGERGDSSPVGASQYERSSVRVFKTLGTVPLSERPAKSQSSCLEWGAELMWNRTKDRLEKCPSESDVATLLTFPFASTGEKFGVIRTFSAFANRELETARLRAVEKPKLTVSIWLYLLNWCTEKLCGIIKHVNEDRKYASPLLMLSSTGNIVVQVCLVTGEEKAFTAHIDLPLRTWIRLDLFIRTSEVKLIIIQADSQNILKEAEFRFQNAILYNDTSGYFAIGGGVYMPGPRGYFGPLKYYRLGAEKVANPLTPLRTLTELNTHHRRCEDVKQIADDYIAALRTSRAGLADDACVPYYEGLRRTSVPRRCRQPWSWEHQLKYGAALKILRRHEDELMSGLWSSRKASLFAQLLYQEALEKLADDNPGKIGSSVIELLELCSCWGHHQASLMLATLHLSGLGVPADPEKAHVYSLMGAVEDERLALLHLGYKHAQGLDGFPADLDMAYGYYANIAKQTSVDHDRVQDSEQALTEHVRVADPEDLQMQTGESDDVIQFLKHQAERGDVESQKTLARMLYFGSNGMTKDIGAAVKWYARSAMQMTDPSAMHDYGVMLLKGIGGKRNKSLALKLLEKAADMGSVEALNALGWYHSTMENNARKAVYYFHLAARNGSRDGLFNLGVYYLNGAADDAVAMNETEAFQCFLKAGELGHVDAAVEAASAFSRGHTAGVRRDPERAVSLLKRVSERNGHLGFAVRDALRAFQRGSWDEALLKYALLAETGFVVAQLNAAHLCEVMKHESSCHWRYLNYSTHNHLPHESGLLKMGDHYSASGDMVKAVALYSRAALSGSAQGMYNLAVLTGEGFHIPTHVLEQIHISTEPDLSRTELSRTELSRTALVENLLIRCRQLEGSDEELTPCSLALMGLHVSRAWQGSAGGTARLTLILTTFLVLALAMVTQSALARYAAALPRSFPYHPSDPRSEPQHRSSGVTAIGPTLAPRRLRSLQEAAGLVVTASGVCACAWCTVFISHLLKPTQM